MKHSYSLKNVCSKRVIFEIEDEVVRGISFEGGCPGNLQGVARLADNRPVSEVIDLLSGIKCGKKDTSCPDQLAKNLKKCLRKSK